MRDIIRRIWRWVFGPRYYVVRMQWSYGGPEFTAHSHAWWYGGCPKTAVFDDYDNALRFWRSRFGDGYDPGFTYTIVDVTDWEDTLEEYFYYNPEKAPCR